jgi:hypothetical protein
MEFVVTTRFEGATLSPINEYPCFVFIALPKGDLDPRVVLLKADDLQIIGWGELYRSPEDAAAHRFG